MGIIFFCLTFGTVLGYLGKKAQVVAKFFKIIDEVIMKMISAIMWLSPIGISSVICAKILGVANLAFPTASTAAALPITFSCVEKNFKFLNLKFYSRRRTMLIPVSPSLSFQLEPQSIC